MEAPRVELGHDVEEERVGVVVERLVVQEQLGQQAEVLRVVFVLPTVDLEEGYGVVSVDLVARRMAQVALGLRTKRSDERDEGRGRGQHSPDVSRGICGSCGT